MPDLAVWPTDGADGSVSSEARWRKMSRLWTPSGVTTGTLTPALIAGPAITVQPGAAWMDGHFAELTTVQTVPVTANGLLVLRFTPADNRCELLFRSGTGLGPTQTDPTWELPLAAMAAGVMSDLRYGTVPSGVPIVGGLPPFPYDGQQVAFWWGPAGRMYLLTYFAGAPAPYKWCVDGGPPLIAITGTNEQQGISGIADLATVGPDIVIPYPGIYDVSCGFTGNNSGAGSSQSCNIVDVRAPTVVVCAANLNNPGAGGATFCSVSSAPVAITLPVTTTLRLRYATATSSGFYASRWMSVRPIRVALP